MIMGIFGGITVRKAAVMIDRLEQLKLHTHDLFDKALADRHAALAEINRELRELADLRGRL